MQHVLFYIIMYIKLPLGLCMQVCIIFYYTSKLHVQKVNEIYQDANQGEKFDFDLTREEQIEVLNTALNSQEWIVNIINNSNKVMPTMFI